MKSSRVLSGIKMRTAKEFLSLEPTKNSNYINIITDDGCRELLKDLADITIRQAVSSEKTTHIGICVWVKTATFALYLPQSKENQTMELAASLPTNDQPFIKMIIEIPGSLAPKVSIQEIELGGTTEYYFNPYSDMYSKNPF